MLNRQWWRLAKVSRNAAVSTRLGFLFATVLVLGLVGCDSGPAPTFKVTGTVKFSDGRPLPSGRILFRSNDTDERYSARGGIDSEGSFEISTFDKDDGAVAGSHTVMIVHEVDRDALDEPAETRKRVVPLLDEIYQSFQKTPIEVNVSSDGSSENHFDIIVEPPKKRKKRRR